MKDDDSEEQSYEAPGVKAAAAAETYNIRGIPHVPQYIYITLYL